MYWMWSVGPLRGGEVTGGGKHVSSGEWCRENQACMIWNEWMQQVSMVFKEEFSMCRYVWGKEVRQSSEEDSMVGGLGEKRR